MYKPHKLIQLPLLILLICFTISCSKEGELQTAEILSNENYVDLSSITEIASDILFPKEGISDLKSTRPRTKNIYSIDEIKNGLGANSMYIVNYEEGGYLILSADKRTIPVLAFSVNNSFEVDENQYPPGLKSWMSDSKKQIETLQLSNTKQSPHERVFWDKVLELLVSETGQLKAPPPPDCYDHLEIFTEGPLGVPRWYQRGAFNDDLPYMTCDGSSWQVDAGCVPVAISAVMRYHEYPTSYNWSLMPLTYGTSTSAAFMADIHDAINYEDNDQPEYKCTGTYAYASVIDDVFKDQFNYSSATKASYNYATVTSNISNDRPVILTGNDGDIGHAWVCDGFRRYMYYYADCSMVESLHLHMVWGWGSTHVGYYAFDNFNPGTYSFNSYREMIYNIVP